MTGDAPVALTRLENKAKKHAWRTERRRATGVWKGKQIDSWVLKIQRLDVRLAVSWESRDGGETWAFDCALRQSPFGRLNSREVAAVVTS